MSQKFQKISILGGGLLGGSIALALQDSRDVKLWFRRVEMLEGARLAGFRGVTSDLTVAVANCDLLILAVPVGAMPALLSAAVEAGLPSSCLITDVGSVKQTPHLQLADILTKSGNAFIGSHPMAGSEKNGLMASRADLFRNAACLLTNDSNASEQLVEDLEKFWADLGCRTRWFTAAEHDRIVARISHLPHITAAATALSALESCAPYGELSGGGLKDTTRVASGNPDMWAEILTENRDAVIAGIRDNIA
ncbi:MAG: prephenate dehydrogenase, partial [Akkermansiaceae bacterium]